LGTALVGNGIFCATVGSVTEETIKNCIENHSNKDDEAFKVTE
jgi:hypothetical protein